jgi:hemoglobin
MGTKLGRIGALAMLATLVSCGRGEQQADTTSTPTVDTAAARSLYLRLGGRDAIVTVIDSFVAKVAADNRINKKFARSDVGRVKTMLVDQVCAATGGPCTYTGRSMKEAHRNMKVTEGEFTALVEDLTATLQSLNVPERERNELLGALAAMKADIVEVQSPATGTALPANFAPATKTGTKTGG